MFTGIIEEIGKITEVSDAHDFRTLRIQAHTVMGDLALGSSIAVNGVCLTALSITPTGFSAELSRETINRTSLGNLKPGSIVNLERPVRVDSRLGGHFVQGHVDGVGRIRKFDRTGDAWNLEIQHPEAGSRYVIEKGSISIDGISLTVASLEGSDVFSVAIIPHTFDNTNLKAAQTGDVVNLEFDVLAKYVEKMIQGWQPKGGTPGIIPTV